jgi:ribonuclease D
VDERKGNGDAMMAYATFPNSDSPTSKLVKALCGWLGTKALPEDFDYESILNKEAIITIAHNAAGTWADIVNIGGIPKGTKVAKATEPIVSLFLDEENWNEEVFEEELSDFEKTKVMESAEYAELTKPKAKPAVKTGKKK